MVDVDARRVKSRVQSFKKAVFSFQTGMVLLVCCLVAALMLTVLVGQSVTTAALAARDNTANHATARINQYMIQVATLEKQLQGTVAVDNVAQARLQQQVAALTQQVSDFGGAPAPLPATVDAVGAAPTPDASSATAGAPDTTTVNVASPSPAPTTPTTPPTTVPCTITVPPMLPVASGACIFP